MQVNLDEIEKRIEAGLIRRQWTEDKTLQILNYTAKTQYDRLWDEYTTLARGLILRADGTIHARSFEKFWNLSEPPGPTIETLPDEVPEITLKMDGYLGISYWHNDEIKIASRGSFTSEYAVYANQWLRLNNPHLRHEIQDRNYSLVFEILYPFKRIVVDNTGQFGLVLLTAVHNETGAEVPRGMLEWLGAMLRIPVVPIYKTRTLEECVELAKVIKGTEEEGFVAFYRNAGLRVKIKGDDYCKIHKVVTRLTKKRVWEILACDPVTGKISDVPLNIVDDKLLEITSIVPEEYKEWIWKTAGDLNMQHHQLVIQARNAANSVWLRSEKPVGIERKDIVAKLQAESPELWHEALNMVDGRHERAVESIWKRLEPKHEMPLVREGEDE